MFMELALSVQLDCGAISLHMLSIIVPLNVSGNLLQIEINGVDGV